LKNTGIHKKSSKSIKQNTARILERHNLGPDDIEINIIIETTYEPCYVCKTEILLHQEKLKANILVERPFYIDDKGIKQVVKKHSHFEKILKN